jgi:hypothetical protein
MAGRPNRSRDGSTNLRQGVRGVIFQNPPWPTRREAKKNCICQPRRFCGPTNAFRLRSVARPGLRNSLFALNSIGLDQRSFARRDLHDLVHRADPRHCPRQTFTAGAGLYTLFDIFVNQILVIRQIVVWGIGRSLLTRQSWRLTSRAELAFTSITFRQRLLAVSYQVLPIVRPEPRS